MVFSLIKNGVYQNFSFRAVFTLFRILHVKRGIVILCLLVNIQQVLNFLYPMNWKIENSDGLSQKGGVLSILPSCYLISLQIPGDDKSKDMSRKKFWKDLKTSHK